MFTQVNLLKGFEFVISRFSQKEVDGFWARVDIKDEDDCWKWTAGTNGEGYGTLKICGKWTTAHRIAYEMAYGKAAVNNVLHSCDNPICCNPNHLSDGTHKQNMQDMKLKNRSNSVGRKMNMEKAIQLRKDAITMTTEELANKYRLTKRAVRSIKNNHAYVQ